MSASGSREAHWSDVYARRAAAEVSWYQPEATPSLEMIEACGVPTSTPVVEVGAGASTLVDGLLARGFSDVTLVDLAARALERTRERLGDRAEVTYVTADVTAWRPPRSYGLWHDRAVFHFLFEEQARAAYRRTLAAALAPGGHAVIATFAEDGPERCSGLPVTRWSAAGLAAELGDVLLLVEARRVVHVTPAGAEQAFLFARCERA